MTIETPTNPQPNQPAPEGQAKPPLQQRYIDDNGVEHPPTPPAGDTPQPNQGTEPAPEAPASPYGEAIVSALSNKGIDVNDIATSFEQTGEVSDEHRTALNDLFGKDAVDTYFEGVKARATRQVDENSQAVLDVVGGEEAWQTVSKWAATAPGAKETSEAFNNAYAAGNKQAMQLAAQLLKGQYEAVKGSLNTQSVVTGAPASNQAAAKGFADNNEWLSAMRDPRYKTSTAYRAEVAARLKASANF